MADIFDNLVANLTFNAEEARSNAEIVFTNPYYSPDLALIHGIQTGIMMDKFIPILGQIDDIGRIDPGNCGINEDTAAFAASQKKWEPKLISGRYTICVDDLPKLMKFWSESPQVKSRWEQISNPAKQYIIDTVTNAIQRSIIRISEFGDTNAATGTDAGDLTTGTTVGLFTILNGMWKQLIDEESTTRIVSITENSAATKEEQMALASDTAYKVFKGLLEGISPEGEMNEMTIQCTKSLYDNWVSYVENKSGAYRPELLTDGTTKDTFRGKQIVVRKDWDRLIKKYYDNGTTLYLPHRAIYCDKNIIPIGTRDTDSFKSLDSYYDRVSKKVLIDYAYSIDCKVLVPEYVAAAY